MTKEYTVKTYETATLFAFATREEAQFIANQSITPLRVVAVHILKDSFNPALEACCYMAVPRALFDGADAGLKKSMEPA